METFIFHYLTSFIADSLIDTDLKNSFTITVLGNIHCIIITIPNRYRNEKNVPQQQIEFAVSVK